MPPSFSLAPVTGKTQVLGIIGDPIGHSLSPPMQNAALRHLGWDGIYVPFGVQAAGLEAAVAGLWALGVVGFNVTIPHKQRVMATLQEVTPLAQAVGAVNTVWRTPQGWAGTNTDVQGFVAPLAAMARSWSGQRAVVLGNGGAARAVVAGCHQLQCGEIWVVGRDRAKLEAFAASWHSSPLAPPLRIAPWDQGADLLPEAALVVNTTPVGMDPHGDQSPLAPEVLARLPGAAIAYDLIYTPRPTRFLQLAQAQGLQTFDGVEMLVQQGAAALEKWIPRSAPVEIMRTTLLAHIDGAAPH